MVSLIDLRHRAVRARIATTALPPPVPPQLGKVVLRADQRASAGLVAKALERDGGCLLADDVGVGKTFVALAVSRRWTRPLVVVPASLRSTWLEAMERAHLSLPIVSHEALGRGRPTGEQPDGVIVDESHRFRTTSTKRYASLATLSMRAGIVLLSATPLQNRTRDLAAQIALFHGARAFRLDARALAAFVIRGPGAPDIGLPDLQAPAWVQPVAEDDEVLEAILALPPPPRPVDGGDVGVLRTIGLIRAWASSRATLLQSVRRRRRAAAAIEQCAAAGRLPTKRELRAWHGDEGAIQLGFATLLADRAVEPADTVALLHAASTEQAGLARLERSIAAHADPDEARVSALRTICSRHAPDRVLAFTEFAATARALHSRLRDTPGVGLLTAGEARVASGRVSRDLLLGWFAPLGRGVPSPSERERVTLLITTDLLSEGMNLQDAGVVVHLDLPWNPARLSQRVGRLRRPGGCVRIHSYLMAPPARSELLLDVEQRLRRKLAEAAFAIGRGIDVVPRLTPTGLASEERMGQATRRGEMLARLRRWLPRTDSRVRRGVPVPLVAAVASPAAGWLAALDDGQLVASADGGPPDTGESVAVVVALGEGASCPSASAAVRNAQAQCERWVRAELIARGCGLNDATDELRDGVQRRIAVALGRSPRHVRPTVARLAADVRASFLGPRPLGLEWALRAHLTDGPADDLAWLAHAATLVSRPSGAARSRMAGAVAPRLVALLVLVRPEP